MKTKKLSRKNAKTRKNKKAKTYSKKNKKSRSSKNRRLKKNSIIIIIIIIFILILRSTIKLSNEDTNGSYMSIDSFIKKIEPYAIDEYNKSGILPSITISQAILESNGGNSKLAKEGKNLFGIKVGSSWKGDSITFTTEENHKEYIKARFRKYNSWEESIDDHTKLLVQNPVYRKNGLFRAKTFKAQAQALEDAGYATAMDAYGNKVYADRLIAVIHKYKLYRYDQE